jgi:hypothetical protein
MTIAEFFIIRPQGPNCWIGLGAFRERVRLQKRANECECGDLAMSPGAGPGRAVPYGTFRATDNDGQLWRILTTASSRSHGHCPSSYTMKSTQCFGGWICLRLQV